MIREALKKIQNAKTAIDALRVYEHVVLVTQLWPDEAGPGGADGALYTFKWSFKGRYDHGLQLFLTTWKWFTRDRETGIDIDGEWDRNKPELAWFAVSLLSHDPRFLGPCQP